MHARDFPDGTIPGRLADRGDGLRNNGARRARSSVSFDSNLALNGLKLFSRCLIDAGS